MDTAFRINIWRLGIWLLLPIMGIYIYFHSHISKLLGYSILFLPYCTLIAAGLPLIVRRINPLTISRKNMTSNLSFLVFILLLVVASYRSIASDFQSSLSFAARILFIVVIVLFFKIYAQSQIADGQDQLGKHIWMDIFISIIVFLVFNLFAYLVLGLRSAEGERFIFQGATRISFLESRLEFPFVKNMRELSQMAGLAAIIAFCATLCKTKKGRVGIRELFYAMVIALSLLVIILTDSRMTLFVTLFCLLMLIVFIRYGRSVSSAWVISLFFLAFPLFYFLLLFYANTRLDQNVLDSNFWTLTGRLYVWASVLPEILRLDISQFLFGAGVYSQDLTQLSENYEVLFAHMVDPRSVSYHNAMIQLFFDIGFIGAAVYVMLVLSVLKSYLRRLATLQTNDHDRKMYLTTGLVVLLYFLGLGTTEAITPMYYNSYLIALVILMTSMSIWREKQPPDRPRQFDIAAK